MIKEDTFGQRLRRLRKAQGWKQEDLAAKVGVTINLIKNYEADAPPYPDIIKRIAEALDTPVEYLMSGENPLNSRTLENLENYLKDNNIDGKEAETLRRSVAEMAKRSKTPLTTIEFERLRKLHFSPQDNNEGCERCGYQGISNNRCLKCGYFLDQPDN